ncbi:glycosyltransferase family 9 protein [Trichlorobacter lovleyi]|nr:glycosyltransferase family 9 protein [Trichlorobacter lovleyi]
MKTADALLGRLITNLLPSLSTPDLPESVYSVLLIRPGGIGDAVLLAPVIRQLKVKYPNIQITILAERRNAGVFALVPSVDLLYCYDRPAEFWRAVRDKYDVVIDTEQWHRLSAVIARLIRSPIKIGFATNERRRMFTHALPYSHDEYEVSSFKRLLEPLTDVSEQTEATIPFLTIPVTSKESARKLLATLGDKPFVTIFPGASIPERRWGADRFRAVAAALVQKGYGVVVVGGTVDRTDAQTIADESGLDLAGRTSLAETAAVISRSALLISADSGLLHVAIGLGVPTVSLFGPGRALKWAPRGKLHTVINKNLSCSPCTSFGTTPPCPYNARCMQEISVSEVIDHCVKQIEHTAG